MQNDHVEGATSTALEEALKQGLRGDAQRVMVGLNWTLVVGPDGAGLAHTPARGTEGCRSLPQPGTYAGRTLADLASLWGAQNVFERAIAVAAVNAHWNRYDLEGERANGLDLIENHGERTVMIGRFPGIAERSPGIAVVEREPRAGEYPESALPELLSKAKFVAVTGSAIVNGSMPGILAMCKGAKVLVVGPSTPLAPPLFEQGIDILSGYVAGDVEALARAIGEGASVAAIRPFGRYVTIRRG
jgi:hypothetical protein